LAHLPWERVEREREEDRERERYINIEREKSTATFQKINMESWASLPWDA